jgi:MarR family transcriptional regulator, lower aerobic nicotinate degradation pathway regulator
MGRATLMDEMGDYRAQCLPAELLSNPVFVLGRLGYGLKRQAAEELEEAGFSLYDYSVLALLTAGPCATQATIAGMLELDRSQLVGLLDSLEQRGLVERRRDPNDRRRHTVLLTDEGTRQLEQIRAIMSELAADYLEPLNEQERATLHELLLRVASHHDARFASSPDPVAAVR